MVHPNRSNPLLVVCCTCTGRNWRCPSCDRRLRMKDVPKCANCGTELVSEQLRPFHRQAGWACFVSVYLLSIALLFALNWSSDRHTEREWAAVEFSLIPVMLATSLLCYLSGWSWTRNAPVRVLGVHLMFRVSTLSIGSFMVGRIHP
jgi:uncharacterized protein (DUF983 family)